MVSASGGILNLKGWIPIQVYWPGGQSRPTVGWCLLGEERFTDPFFESTVQRRLSHPFHHAFRRQTPIDVLEEWRAQQPGLAPTGFIFHMSRCGSTLLSQMLAAIDRNIVLSEVAPIDWVLRAHLKNPNVTPANRAEWFRGMVSALGQRRTGIEEHLFIKFDCWNLAEMAVIHLAFPDVPWIFVFRDPVEVLVSQFEKRAPWTFPTLMQPEVLGLDESEVNQLGHQEYCAKVIGRICELAVLNHRRRGGLLIHYSQLPEHIWPALSHHLGFEWTTEESHRMYEKASYNSKAPGLRFESDSERKRNRATSQIRELAARWIDPFYQRLESARVSQSSEYAHH